MGKSLTNNAIKGVRWSFVETFFIYFVKFLIGIILARLLLPEDFGLLALMMVFIAVSDKLVDAGFGQAYIYRQNVDDKDADTVFIINSIVSLIIYVLLFLLAPYIASFYGNDSLTWMIRVFSLVIIISSFSVVQNAIVRRNFLFKKRAIINLIAASISGAVGIGLAYKGYGVWSLIFQHLLEKILSCFIMYLSLNWKFSFSFSRDSAKEMFSYGSWVMVANVIAVVFNNFYRIIIGKLFTAVELGYYERAKQFENIIADTFTGIVGKVAFPTLSRVQDNIDELRVMTSNFVKFSSVFVLPMLACLCVVAHPLINILLTEKWLPAVPYLQLLCCVGFCWPFYYFLPPLFQAVGKTKLATYMTGVLCGLRIVNVLLLSKYGVSSIIIGELLCVILIIIIASIVIKKEVRFNYFYVVRASSNILISTATIVAVGFILNNLLQEYNDYVQLLVPSLIMTGIYIFIIYVLEKETIIKLAQRILYRKNS